MLPDSLLAIDLIETPQQYQSESFAGAVAAGLAKRQKTLPCRFFYDTAGSELFEQICELPEYYPTRTERSILARYAPQMIEAAEATAGDKELALIEFGSGSSVKTRLLIEALLARQAAVHYSPIDISSDFLLEAARTLRHRYSRLAVTAVAAEYEAALAHLPKYRKQARLFLFLGSSIGNFNLIGAVDFLGRISQQMTPSDSLLVGFDLVKEKAVLEAAYNDAAGVTAAFNKNLLVRINHELGGQFDLDQFDHLAPFVDEYSRIEMRLISHCRQSVAIDALGQSFHFDAGEYIHTEDSYKYTWQSIAALAEATDLTIQSHWLDERNWFALVLFRKQK